MRFFVVSMFCLFFIVFVLAFQRKGQKQDGKETLIRYINKDEIVIESQLEELEVPFFQRVVQPIIGKLTFKMKEATKSKSDQSKDEKTRAKIRATEKLLRMAGMHTSYENYRFFKIAFSVIVSVLAVGVSFIAGLGAMYTLLIVVAGIAMGIVMPDFLLKSQVKSHQAAIRSQLPDVMDILGVCMAAGLSFDAAIAKIAERMDGPFVEELMTAFKQMQMGVSRSDALKAISDCSDINELKTLMSSLVQASTLGIPITNVIDVQSKQLRATRRETAKEKGMKAPVKISFPIMVLIFPALIVVCIGPTILETISTVKGG